MRALIFFAFFAAERPQASSCQRRRVRTRPRHRCRRCGSSSKLVVRGGCVVNIIITIITITTTIIITITITIITTIIITIITIIDTTILIIIITIIIITTITIISSSCGSSSSN